MRLKFMKRRITGAFLISLVIPFVLLNACAGKETEKEVETQQESPAVEDYAPEGEKVEEESLAADWGDGEEETDLTENENIDNGGSETAKAPESFLEKHGIRFTKPGPFSFTTAINDKEKDTGNILINATVEELSESIEVEGETIPEGYMQVKAVFKYDLSEANGSAGVLMDGVFDGYTGVSFEFEDGKPLYDQRIDIPDVPEGYNRITVNGKTYDISLKDKLETNYPEMVKTFVLTCPIDYDGAVFYAGYDSLELSTEEDKVDKSLGFHTLDELPFLSSGHDYYYFSTKTLRSDYDPDGGNVSSGSTGGKEGSENGGSGYGPAAAKREKEAQNNNGDNNGSGSERRMTDEDIIKLAKLLSGAPNAVIEGSDPDGTLNIRVYGKDTADTWDWYYIDPVTLEGTNILGEPVNLNDVMWQ